LSRETDWLGGAFQLSSLWIHANLFYNEKENKLFCRMSAPDEGALSEHYAKAGLTYDWILEVKTTK
jgi:hypothetical protein